MVNDNKHKIKDHIFIEDECKGIENNTWTLTFTNKLSEQDENFLKDAVDGARTIIKRDGKR